MSREILSPRSEAKRDAILAAATTTFLARGYEVATMDEIAAAANVSKRTVYNRYPSKHELFGAVIAHLYKDLLDAETLLANNHEEPEVALPKLAKVILAHLRKPEILGLLRLIAAEQERLPEIAAEFFKSGKGPAIGLVQNYLAAESARGRLTIADPLLAAQQFLGMIKESVFWPRLIGMPVVRDDDSVVRAATEGFLKIYAGG
ncbi:TetR/AcrR family transcriptional regulator [Methylovirgula sp. 4M-Z18]|uniref:TetR/AcrR family transcriptional regulator n=1 Tax=Methylovirgula sp. 4M-Z18 TaxID=2293567 RepID=UPI000E2E4E82|nr:TetR/AcrR family transcriptional regulator [Methylovirgula sp. 4M-Z18]RFB78516.1 TetR/AcrR family transcriptional regulator [Methylovirgula sp. 4M-Z18]